MTSTNKTTTTADELWAKLDAMDITDEHKADAATAGYLPTPSEPAWVAEGRAQAQLRADALAVPVPRQQGKGKGKALAAAALAGITSGHQRRELHRPGKGKARELTVPITSQGRLDTILGELTAGRSRRYAQDLEGWCRASLADGAQRGVLVVWDGLDYSIKLHQLVAPRQVVEVQRDGLRAWLDQGR
jgi:hypothetical protein